MRAEELNTRVNLTETGGTAFVILGTNFDIPSDYEFHPQIVSIAIGQLPQEKDEIAQKIPVNTKIVFIGGDIPSAKFGMLRTVLSQRRLPFVQRRNQTALADAITRSLPQRVNGRSEHSEPLSAPLNAVAKASAPRGSLKDLVLEADLSKGSAEEARRLMHVAQQRGISTTVASIAQAISVAKRKGRRTETPRSLMSAQQKALTTLDEAIAGLQLIREYVAETEALNLSLTQKLEKFRQALKDE